MAGDTAEEKKQVADELIKRKLAQVDRALLELAALRTKLENMQKEWCCGHEATQILPDSLQVIQGPELQNTEIEKGDVLLQDDGLFIVGSVMDDGSGIRVGVGDPRYWYLDRGGGGNDGLYKSYHSKEGEMSARGDAYREALGLKEESSAKKVIADLVSIIERGVPEPSHPGACNADTASCDSVCMDLANIGETVRRAKRIAGTGESNRTCGGCIGHYPRILLPGTKDIYMHEYNDYGGKGVFACSSTAAVATFAGVPVSGAEEKIEIDRRLLKNLRRCLRYVARAEFENTPEFASELLNELPPVPTEAGQIVRTQFVVEIRTTSPIMDMEHVQRVMQKALDNNADWAPTTVSSIEVRAKGRS